MGTENTQVVTVVRRDDGIDVDRVTATTPAGQPNVIIRALDPLAIIAARALRTYLQTLVGLLGAGQMMPTLMPATDFKHALLTAAGLALAPAVISVIQNAIELLGRVVQNFPVPLSSEPVLS